MNIDLISKIANIVIALANMLLIYIYIRWRKDDSRAKLIVSIEYIDHIVVVIKNIGKSVAIVESFNIQKYIINGNKAENIKLNNVTIAPNKELYFTTKAYKIFNGGIKLAGVIKYRSGNHKKVYTENINVQFSDTNALANIYSTEHNIWKIHNDIKNYTNLIQKIYREITHIRPNIIIYTNRSKSIIPKERIKYFWTNVGSMINSIVRIREIENEYEDLVPGFIENGDKVEIEAFDVQGLFNCIKNNPNEFYIEILDTKYQIISAVGSIDYTSIFDGRLVTYKLTLRVKEVK